MVGETRLGQSSSWPVSSSRGSALKEWKQLSETKCQKLGYVFGIYDQYAIIIMMRLLSAWITLSKILTALTRTVRYGTVVLIVFCAHHRPEYVRRNYDEFERLGIKNWRCISWCLFRSRSWTNAFRMIIPWREKSVYPTADAVLISLLLADNTLIGRNNWFKLFRQSLLPSCAVFNRKPRKQ